MNLKKIKFKKLIYPIIFGTFIIIIVVVFISAAKFLSEAINRAFVLDARLAESHLIKLDLPNFYLVAKKLGIEISQPGEQTPVEVINPPATTAATTTEEIPVDISLINLEILNGTATKGLAADWKEKFVVAGFSEANIKTGNADNKNYSGIAVYHNSDEKILAKITDVFSQNNISAKTEIDSKLSNNSFTIIIGK